MNIHFKTKVMKNSRIFLILALLIISISAVASMNGMKKLILGYYYLKGTRCVYVNQPIPCSPGGNDCVYIDPATSAAYPCYLDAACTTSLGRD